MNIFRILLYYITPASTKQVEELRKQRENLLAYKYNARRAMRDLQAAYLRVRIEREIKCKALTALAHKLETQRKDNANLRAALFPEQETTSGARG